MRKLVPLSPDLFPLVREKEKMKRRVKVEVEEVLRSD
jgi:hypothetical protein